MTPVLVAVAAASALLLLAPSASRPRAPTRSQALGGAAVALAVIGWGLVRSLPPIPVLIAGAALLAVAQQVRRHRVRTTAARRRDDAIEACAALAAELQAGRTAAAALVAVAADWAELRPVADAARLGSDVPAALALVAARPGAASLRWVAAAWAVAHRSGAGLAGAVGLAARAMEEERATARVLEIEIASARATARLLAVLPVGVLLIGRGAGGDPVGFLMDTGPGTSCLLVGLLLAWSGLLWMDRIAAVAP